MDAVDVSQLHLRKAGGFKRLTKEVSACAPKIPNETYIVLQQVKISYGGFGCVWAGECFLCYEIIKPLVIGTYSTVYLVSKTSSKGPAVKMAMKAENLGVTSESTGYALANEIRFLVEFQKRWRDQVRWSDYLPQVCDFGHSKKYKFMILPLLGPNLDQLRDEMKSEFSYPTAARLSLQALNAVSMLHQIRMLHTRIEPTHFCIGTEHRRNVLYLVGLGHISTFSRKPTW
ncbi:unnamed protein product [Nippostrongylus brasiliensis]|uniref:Protein kinase domain-containing protein n=1 Tax=Nippostrongylus brasiliensis TaxID=27835 RepID=A0A0N4YDL6_NIPBR|nr:unnamed protein product [Nippostrongylus brasiliensis]